MRRKLMGDKMVRPAPWILAAKNRPNFVKTLLALVARPSSSRQSCWPFNPCLAIAISPNILPAWRIHVKYGGPNDPREPE